MVETITGTRRPPFYVAGKGFVPAGALAIGNSIVTRAGPALVVKSVTWKRRVEGYDVYNFVVEDDHTNIMAPDRGRMTLSKFKNVVPQLLLTLGILAHLLFLLSLKFGWLNPLFNDSMHRFGPGGDFFSIYAAGVKARTGESVYTIGGHVAQVPYAYAFRYAPLVAFTLGLAVSFLPALSASGLWLIICELTLLRCLRLSVERAPTPAIACLVAALWLLFSPFYLELYVGQFTFVTAALVFQAYLAWQDAANAPPRLRKRLDLFGNGIYTLAVWLKMMPLLFLPLALWRGRWKSVVVALSVLLGTSWLYFARHPGDWAVFLDINGEPTPTWHAGNQGLMAFLYAAVGERAPAFANARLLAFCVVGSGLAWLIYRLWRIKSVSFASAALPIEPGISSLPELGAGGRTPSPELETEGRTPLLFPQSWGSGGEARQEQQGLWLYGACSAAYLLLYKDVWEHHYVLLLPPLVFLALRREPARLWMPPFILCALPTLFALYDVRSLGYNEDPQRYWQSGVSLLHHSWKPLAPLWLFGGLLWRDLALARQDARCCAASAMSVDNTVTAGLPQGHRLRVPPWVRIGLVAMVCLMALGGARWAAGAIAEQRRVTRQLTWPESVFALQQRKETCGPAALAAVCRYFHIPATEAEVARLAQTSANGTTMLGLQQAAQAKGLLAEGQERSVDELASLPRPCILYFHQGHFAVLTGIADNRFYVADPSLGQRVWTREQLTYLWRGELLLVGPAH